VLEVLSEDYIVTARAKGVKERTVLFKHALKNACLPIITNMAMHFGAVLLAGAIITEGVFAYGGLGTIIYKAISMKETPIMQAIFYVISLCVIIANFIADLLYGVIDPRVRYG
jgi:peptide/nickel transport system permease protein